MAEPHVLSIEYDGDSNWWRPQVRDVCSCGHVGEWRDPYEFAGEPDCPDAGD